MLTFKLINRVATTELSEWEALKTDVLGQSIHPDRAQGFYFSREALRECFQERSVKLSVKDLVLDRYDKLKTDSSYTISLSHTPQWGAAVLGARTDYQSLGIDIELKNRVVKDAILERISHIEDLKMNPLQLWTLKEATFKALMNTGHFELPIEFSSIQIIEDHWLHSPTQLRGEWKVMENSELMIAISWIRT